MTTAAPHPQPARDPAGQPERTRFAWRRTMLAATVVVLLATRSAAATPNLPVAGAATAAVLAGWLLVLVVSWRRIRAMAGARPAPVRWAVPLTAFATVGLAGLGLLLTAAP